MTEEKRESPRRTGSGYAMFMLLVVAGIAYYAYEEFGGRFGFGPATAVAPAPMPAATAQTSTAAVPLTEAAFRRSIASGVQVVDFWATWCGPCRRQAPIMDSVAKRYAGRIGVGKVDVDAEEALAKELNIQSIPTILIFKNGMEVARSVGVTEEASLVRAIEQLL